MQLSVHYTDVWFTVRDGMLPSSHHIGNFNSQPSHGESKPWSIFSSGKAILVNINKKCFYSRPKKSKFSFSFKAVKTKEGKLLANNFFFK